jgi:hypothetical protein
MELMNTRKLNLGISAMSLLFVLLISGCHNPPSIEETLASLRSMQPARSQNSSVENKRTDSSSQIDNRTAPMDSVTYWKMVRDSCPELFRKDPLSPYEAFEKCKSAEMRGWDSEVGIDKYFQRYAKVLQKRSGKAMTPIRKATKDAQRLLYFIANELSGGGTFYSHMLARSEGSLEYSLYKFEKGETDFSNLDFDKEREVLFRKWKKNIHNSILAKKIDNFNGVSDTDLEKQLLDSLSKMKSLVKTPFTLTYLDEFGHSFYSDLKF